VDIFVNNAGIQYTANIEDFPTDKWDAIIAINLSSAFHTTHHALPGIWMVAGQHNIQPSAESHTGEWVCRHSWPKQKRQNSL